MDNINSSIGQDPDSKFLIGVLDIYGFESFKTNRCLTGMPFVCIIDRNWFFKRTDSCSSYVSSLTFCLEAI